MADKGRRTVRWRTLPAPRLPASRPEALAKSGEALPSSNGKALHVIRCRAHLRYGNPASQCRYLPPNSVCRRRPTRPGHRGDAVYNCPRCWSNRRDGSMRSCQQVQYHSGCTALQPGILPKRQQGGLPDVRRNAAPVPSPTPCGFALPLRCLRSSVNSRAITTPLVQ